ncbi:MAG: class I SAM-dependent methyltransferase, partial [Chloroflexi bacterium]|nr:class I SAM-dependent methyltransferase [Chloroflexota bacterium]
MFWDKVYGDSGQVWGDKPSELAVAAASYLRKQKLDEQPLAVLDIGCGYGRDALYLAANLRCAVLGVDASEKAIEIATRAVPREHKERVKFQKCNFVELDHEKYDIVFASHLYHLLKDDERKRLRRIMGRMLKPDGLLFLSTLSVKDPEHYGKGDPVPGEANSFHDKTYLHFCTKEELIGDFDFLYMKEIYEHEFYESR